MKNYLSLNRFSLLYDHYAIIDVPEYYADQLFIRHQVTVRFGKEFQHPDQPYVVIFCKVRKRDRNRFLSALHTTSAGKKSTSVLRQSPTMSNESEERFTAIWMFLCLLN